MKTYSAVDRQKQIYIEGLRGRRSVIPIEYNQLRKLAEKVMSARSFAYIDGGAGQERTMAANRRALDRWQIVPRMMRDVGGRSLSASYLGQKYQTPFFLCPIGVLELANRDADIAVARAASSVGIPMLFSNQASRPMEQVTAAMGQGPRMFQLYWSKSDELVASFLRRAKDCECSAIVVTLDTTLLGWRTRDLQQGFLPFLYAMGMAQYTSDPIFQRIVAKEKLTEAAPDTGRPTFQMIQALYRMAKIFPGSTWQNFRTKKPLAAIRKFIDIYMRPSLQWSDLASLRQMTDLPILLKGIQHVDDAKKAIDLGVEGLIVSNHGGRQVDGAIGSLDALAKIGDAVGDQTTLLFDSGIRNGSDAFKAVALGARAVGIGRPYAFGLAVGGQDGVENVLQNIMAEFELTMALSGCRSIEEIDRNMVTLTD